MAPPVSSWLSRHALLRTLLARLRLAWRLLRDPGVSWLLKLLALAPLVYIVSPLDFVPDVLPFFGQLDDLGVLLFAVATFIRLAPADVVAHHQASLDAGRPYAPWLPQGEPDGRVIDAQWRRE
jgi:uncharacterized membrane protein YkvA (DUF1232 family)